MIKSLFLLSALIGVHSMPVASYSNDKYYGVQQRQYQHTENVGNTEVTYEYESNEVNSVDDLVSGHIYQMNIPLDEGLQLNFNCTKIMLLNGRQTIMTYDSDFIANVNDSYFNVYVNNNNLVIYHQPSNTSVSNRSYEQDIHFLFVYKDYLQSGLIPYVSYTDYNQIVSVTYTPSVTLFGRFSDFLNEHIFNGIPNIDNVLFTIGENQITMRSWLVTTTSIVFCGVLLTILCFFIRWLFKLFSNTLLLR